MTVNNDTNIKLAEIIRKTRKIAGLTQIELAKKANVGKTLIFNIEKDSSKASFENLLKVLKVLNIKIHFQLPYEESDE